MKTFNIIFNSFEELETFLKKHIKHEKNEILLQIFSGYVDNTFLEELIQFVLKFNPNVKIIGTTTDGEIMEGNILKNSVVLSFSLFEQTDLSTFYIDLTEMKQKFKSNCSFYGGVELAKKMNITEKTKGVIIFGDGLTLNGEEFLNGFASINNSVLIAGGLAGDNANFINTYTFTEKIVLKEGVVAVKLDSDVLHVNSLYFFGWQGIGKEFEITKSKKNLLIQLNNRPVLDTYAKYLGEYILHKLPKIGVEIPFVLERDGIKIARAVIGKQHNKLLFAGNLNKGEKVQFGIANISNTQKEMRKMEKLINNSPIETIFIYSCMARKSSMKLETERELKKVSEYSNSVGFFTYGEFFSQKQKNGSFKYYLFNETFTAMFLSEKDDIKYKNIEFDESQIKEKIDDSYCIYMKEALSNFINITTQELYETNKKLENKVQEEVEKNIKKQLLLQQQTKQAQMGEMVSMIAHQWRQPLNAISLYASNIELDIQFNDIDKERILEAVAVIQKQVQKMSNVINSFMEFSKPDTKQVEFSIKDIIMKSMDIMGAQLKARGIELQMDYYDEPIEIISYPTLLEQVIINLVANARDAFENKNIEDKIISIKCYLENDNAYIIIKDNAGGIPKEAQDRIFNPYFTTKGTKGTGLGLYMSKNIIEDKFAGQLSFKVENDTTTFIIKIGEKVLKIGGGENIR
jgi:signal transduction histidine kinase